MIGANDLFIAAHARGLGITLVTNSRQDRPLGAARSQQIGISLFFASDARRAHRRSTASQDGFPR
jgi:hypothetical protein